ncbi:hypothetical protein V5799_011046 [Amblyomma americanum]|uniref:Fatty acid synthase n=1 Tax=Amblyomma americanum TaxID=6943 RepID=A0AAQ4EJ11_AMBAM
MAALNEAVLALRSGHCEAAIVGGSNVTMEAALSTNFLRLGLLSEEGKCKAFDSNGKGYVRSESVGAFFLQRASEARRFYAKVVNVKSNADGFKSEGVTYPSGKLQEELLREVYAEANVDPTKVSYVEAHGTGTKAGDTQELGAISNVFCQPGRAKPLKIGSVKSNMGHAESACGVPAVAKVILAMETGSIAANLHFSEPNQDVPALLDGRIEVVDRETPFYGGLVGVNSFGFGGANVHTILEANPGPSVDSFPREKPQLPRLVLMAGRKEDSLENSLTRLEADGPFPDSAYALLNRVGQPSVKQFPYRGYALVPVDGGSGKEILKVVDQAPFEKRPLWFVFTGMGCQWTGMARQMMHFDLFARSIRKCHDVLEQYGIDLIDLVTSEEARKQTMVSPFISIAAVQVALVELLRAIGLQPDGLVGHSVGEIGCAYADGGLTAEQTVLCSYWRGRCTELGNLPKGAMAAVGLTWEEATKRCPFDVYPACHNAEDSVTVSGPADAVAEMVAELKAENIFARLVDTLDVAFHCKHIHSIGPALHEALSKPILRRALGPAATCLGVMKRDTDNLDFFLGSLGKLHTLGVQMDLSPLYPPVPWPVPRGTPNIGHLVSWDHSETWTVAGWKDFPTAVQTEVDVDVEGNETDKYLTGHKPDGRVLFPASGYLVLAWKCLASRHAKPLDQAPVVLEDVILHRATILPKTGSVRFKVNLMPASGEFEVCESGSAVARGRIRLAEEGERVLDKEPPEAPEDSEAYDLDGADVYKELRLRGYEYYGSFQAILKAGVQKPHAKLKWEDNWVTFIDAMLQLSVLSYPHRSFILPVSIQSCRIDPKIHAEVIGKAGDAGVDAICNWDLNTCRAGGVALRGLSASVAQRRPLQQNPVLEEYRFVPYEDDEATREQRESRVREYVEACCGVAHRIVDSYGDGKAHLHDVINGYRAIPEDQLSQYIENPAENHGLLEVLISVLNESKSSTSLASTVQSALLSSMERLQKDLLNTALFEEDPLRHLLDVVVENTSLTKIRVLELAGQGRVSLMTPWAHSYVSPYNVQLKTEYTVAHPSPDAIPADQIPEGVRTITWSPSTVSQGQMPEVDLVIVACGVTGVFGGPETLAQELSSVCKDRGFVLLSHRTALTGPELFLSKLSGVPLRVHTMEEMTSALKARKFQLVGMKSNNLSELLLFRKIIETVDVTKQAFIRVKNDDLNWVQTLKDKAVEHDSKAVGENIWLLAEGADVSGIVGLTNCVRQETGGRHIRYARATMLLLLASVGMAHTRDGGFVRD